MPPGDRDIPISYLRECFELREDGVLIWRARPREHFATKSGWRKFTSRFAGKIAGVREKCYLRVYVQFKGRKRRLVAHRVILALHHGEWPEAESDHRNGDGIDNRLSNLRVATHAQQQQNQKFRATNTSGFTGVTWDKNRRCWSAGITAGGKRINLGRFDDARLASAAYLAAKRKHHTFQPELR